MDFLKLFLLVILSIIQLNVSGQIILKLENVPSATLCNDIWTEENLNLSLIETTSSDCSKGGCFFEIEPTLIWMFPSRMTVDLSTLQNITMIEIDIVDFCNINCTRAFLTDINGMPVDNTGNIVVISGETLTLLNPTDEPLSELNISSCEGQIEEIRIFQSMISSVDKLYDSPFLSYPNPGSATDDLHFKVLNNSHWLSLERIGIYDSNGIQVYSKEINDSEDINGLFIPAIKLPKGIFFVWFKSGDQFFEQKIIRL